MSAIVTTGCFETKKTSVSNLFLARETFHRMLNGNDDSGPLRWFLNNGHYAKNSISKTCADQDIVEKLRVIFLDCNPLLHEFIRLAEEPAEEARLNLTVDSKQKIAVVIIPERNGAVKKKTVVC